MSYPFIDDFESYTTGVAPPDYSTLWEGSGATWTVEEDSGNKVLRGTSGSNGYRLIVPDLADISDFEVRLRTRRAGSFNSAIRGGVGLCASGTGGSTNGYHVNIGHSSGGSTNGNILRLMRLDNNAQTVIVDAGFISIIDSWTWIKVRKVGSRIRAAAWADGDLESLDWVIDEIDATHTTGKTGISFRNEASGNGFHFDDFSIHGIGSISNTGAVDPLTDPDGNPAENYIVTAISRDSPYPVASAVVDSNGRYTIAGLPKDGTEYNVIAQHPDAIGSGGRADLLIGSRVTPV